MSPNNELKTKVELETAYRQTMRTLCTTVGVVTTHRETERLGMTINSATSVSMDPPTILFSLNNKSSLIQLLATSKKACVNILNDKQVEIAKIFSSLPSGDFRFKNQDWFLSDDYVLLHEAKAHIKCEIHDILQYHTHSLFICNVVNVEQNTNLSPLLYQDGCFINKALEAV